MPIGQSEIGGRNKMYRESLTAEEINLHKNNYENVKQSASRCKQLWH